LKLDDDYGEIRKAVRRICAAMSSMPMYLNTHAEHLCSLDDIKEDEKIAVTAGKVSIPAIIVQMYSHAPNDFGAFEPNFLLTGTENSCEGTGNLFARTRNLTCGGRERRRMRF